MQRQHCSNMSFNRRNSSNSSNSTNSTSSKLWPRRPSISKVSFPSIKKLSPSSSSSNKPSISSAAKDINNNAHAKAIQIIDGSDRTTDTLLSQDEISILHEYQEYHRRLHEIREKNLRAAVSCAEQESMTSIRQYEASNTATNQYSYPPPHTATAVAVSNRGRRSHSSSSKDTRRSRSSSRSKESRKYPSPQPRRSSSSRGRRQRSSSRGSRHSTYESTNISNMTLTATKRQSNNDIDDVELVPTLEEQQSYINTLAAATAKTMAQECTLPTRRISSSGTATASTNTEDDDDEGEEQPSMEISFPDICCPHHSYVHLKRYSTKTNKWLTLLEECPVCYKLVLPSLSSKEVEDDQQLIQEQRQKQEEVRQQEKEGQHNDEGEKKERRRSSTSSQASSGSYNKIFKIEGQYVLSL